MAMTNAALKVSPHLKRALERLPRSDGKPEAEVRVAVPMVESAESRGTEAQAPAEVPTVEVEFHRGTLTSGGGNVQPVWVFEGPLRIDADAAPPDREPDHIGDWLRSQLGPRCLAVTVENVAGNEVTVRVAAAISSPVVHA